MRNIHGGSGKRAWLLSLATAAVVAIGCNKYREPTEEQKPWWQLTGSHIKVVARKLLAPTVVLARTLDEEPTEEDLWDSPDNGPVPKTREEIEEAIERVQAQLQREEMQHKTALSEQKAMLQAEIDHLKKENENTRMRYLQLHSQLENGGRSGGAIRKKTAIEMYSDVLDLLSKYNKDYCAQDHMPRIVVVGDQSAGKTSVLEMLAQARIFPRGHGEMMTKTPVQVTLSDAPLKRAWFAEGDGEYDLSVDSDLKRLRTEIQQRMARSIAQGRTVSTMPVTLHIQGPGLPRLVMVDLPGIIGHMTKGMASNTKEEIAQMAQYYMSNPNAIIVCVQDGSVDAERSNVADLVSSVDPTGDRTIFVLTKVDKAEDQKASPTRMRSIMEGRLFRMNALGYFAVVTGQGDPNEAIADIKQYEREFFSQSSFLRDGVLKPKQTTTDNLSKAVTHEFWRKVQSSVEAQATQMQAELAKKELEWKNRIKGRMMTRDELLLLGKHEILESIALFNDVKARDWEGLIQDEVWKTVSTHFIHDVYMQSARNVDKANFTTRVAIGLSECIDQGLAEASAGASQQLVMDEFEKAVMQGSGLLQGEGDVLFAPLKRFIVERCQACSVWPAELANRLRVIQRNCLADDVVPDREAWEAAADFMAVRLHEHAQVLAKASKAVFGPGPWEQWLKWKSLSAEQSRGRMIRDVLTVMMSSDQLPRPFLEAEDRVTARVNVKKQFDVDVTKDEIDHIYDTMYKAMFVEKALKSAAHCRPLYNASKTRYDMAPNGLGCEDVVMFWRIYDMLRSSSKALRRQVSVHKGQLEHEAREALDSVAASEEHKRDLLVGDRVDLAEQIDILRHIVRQLRMFDEMVRALPATAILQL